MKIRFWKIGILGILWLAYGCKSGGVKPEESSQNQVEELERTINETKSLKKVIVFFGNSLTAGYGLDSDVSFPSLLQQRLDSMSMPYTVVNAGVSGETTAGGLSRIDWILEQPVDIFVLELGGNDVLRGLDLDQTQKNLQMIIDRVKSKNPAIKIVLAGMLSPPNMGQEYSNRFNKIYPLLAKENNLLFIPFLLEGVAGIPDFNLPDGIHPNEQGQKLVMGNVWRVLKEIL